MQRKVTFGTALLTAAIVFVMTSSAAGAVIHVKWDSPGPTFDGNSWETAYHAVHEGLDAAVSGDEVWGAAGTYVENITLKDGVGLYGGFAGTETAREQRNWTVNVTILDGNQSGSVVTAPEGATSAAVIDGFTIRNGNGTSIHWIRRGGGINCRYSSPTITNNTITANSASYGGGISCYEYSSPTIASNTITENSATQGGGIRCEHASSPTITNNAITRNGASGIYCDYSSPTITNNTILGNRASGIYCGWHSSPTIVNNTITGNDESGIYCSSSSPTITNNTMTGNGAGIGCHGSSAQPMVVNNIVAFNASGIYNSPHGMPTLRHNDVYGNAEYDYSGLPDPTGTDGNISVDPKLASVGYGNVHIQPDSPCIDAGDDSVVQPGWVDMDGQPRIQGAHVDIGADESDGTVWAEGPYVIVRVSSDGDDANDGSSWALAKQTVQAGVDAASTQGGEVWVKAGVYHGQITLHPYVYLYGGFAGTETARHERDGSGNITILDGQDGGDLLVVEGGYMCAAIDGFTIRNANLSGICCKGGSPTITNNTIAGNFRGIYCGDGSPTITNNTIVGNSDGIDCHHHGTYYHHSSATIANNIVAFNARGVYVFGDTPTMCNNCVYGNTVCNFQRSSSEPWDPTGTDGNISVDPKLAGLEYGKVHIQPDSPCMDAGDDGAVDPTWLDMDGQPRIQGAHVDIGADESDGTLWEEGPYVIVRVSPDGDDANDGSSWALAKRTVQAGIDAASTQGGEVWVKAGVYCERIVLHTYAYLYGGFAGTETTREERDWLTHITILDGQQAGTVVTVRAGHMLSTIDGFTIRNGRGPTYGGGICCSHSSPTITNNTISENSAAHGAGIYCEGSSATIANNTITDNKDGYGGGIYCQGASPTIANNTITGNSRSGIYCQSASPTITNNTVRWNSAYEGGGINCRGSSGTITNNTITANSAYEGGGICCQYSSDTITNNTIAGNSAYEGGGICCDDSSPTITNNTIMGNSGSTEGGGLYCSGVHRHPTLLNNIVAFNSSGICNDQGTPTLRYNCVYGNTEYNYSGLSDPTGTDGNISVDPKLASVGYGNVHIQPDSPCIDAGDDSVVQPGWVDMDGQPRIQGAHVDIGSDESDGAAWPQGPYVIVRVSPDGDDANDGSSWALAKQTVQAGIDAASTWGGEVWVKAGVYCERIILHTYAYLYGGFAGTETTREERDWVTHITILDGQRDGSVVTVRAGRMLSTIDGFTIRNGRGPTYGGGICCSHSSPIIANNTITANWAPHGGGISCYEYSSPTITNNTITGNSASHGGGIDCDRYSSPTIINNTIIGNSSHSSSDHSGLSGGIHCSDSSPTITNNTITANSSWDGAGGIYCNRSSPTIENNTITGNTKTHLYGWGSGGILCHDSSPRVANNTIVGNSSALGVGGILCLRASSQPIVVNNIVAFNSSGIYNSQGTLALRHNDVYGNAEYDYEGLTPGVGDISLDPLFADPAGGDYHLRFDSPCIDAGTNEGAPSTDMDGNPRPVDGDCDGLAVTDIGAYEYQPIRVQVDVLPGNDANVIRPNPKRLITVAILSDAVFDARWIDPMSVVFGPGRAAEVHGRGHWEDVNRDGLVDLLLHFSCGASGIAPADESVTLCGWTLGGERITGSDRMRVIVR